jgi:hypothetical protein
MEDIEKNTALRHTFAKREDQSFLISSTIYWLSCNKKIAKSLPKIVYVLKRPTGGFISQGVMPENPIPATQPEAGAAAGEFIFTKPEPENPRIKKRSLKAKPAGLIKPTAAALPSARELEREAPPLSAEQVVKPASVRTEEIMAKPAAKAAETPVAPPRTTPATSIPARATSKTAASSAPTAGPASSPHGTRPATLYYSSPTRKAETPSPMKTIPSASQASSPSAAASPAPRRRRRARPRRVLHRTSIIAPMWNGNPASRSRWAISFPMLSGSSLLSFSLARDWLVTART